jgi:hypothetical protein
MRAVTPHRAVITASGRPDAGLPGHATCALPDAVTVSPDHLLDVERLRGLAGLADSELPPQAVAITAKPAIAIVTRARHKERFDPNGLVNSAGLARTGGLWVGAGNGRRHAVPRPGAPGPRLERGSPDGE